MQVNKEQILLDAIEEFGAGNQIEMAIEECAELIQALNKIKRTFNPQYLHLLKANGGHRPFENTKEALIFCNVCSEIADVKIMIQQLEKIFSKEHIDISEERKLIRLEGRIDKWRKEKVQMEIEHNEKHGKNG